MSYSSPGSVKAKPNAIFNIEQVLKFYPKYTHCSFSETLGSHPSLKDTPRN